MKSLCKYRIFCLKRSKDRLIIVNILWCRNQNLCFHILMVRFKLIFMKCESLQTPAHSILFLSFSCLHNLRTFSKEILLFPCRWDALSICSMKYFIRQNILYSKVFISCKIFEKHIFLDFRFWICLRSDKMLILATFDMAM